MALPPLGGEGGRDTPFGGIPKCNLPPGPCQDIFQKIFSKKSVDFHPVKWKDCADEKQLDSPIPTVDRCRTSRKKIASKKCAWIADHVLARKSSLSFANSKRNIWKSSCQTGGTGVDCPHAKRDDSKASGWVRGRIFRSVKNALPRVFHPGLALQNWNEIA